MFSRLNGSKGGCMRMWACAFVFAWSGRTAVVKSRLILACMRSASMVLIFGSSTWTVPSSARR
jgi:hypothetical protein